MKVYLLDGRTGEIDLSEKALIALYNAARNHRLGMPMQIKVDGHFEMISMSQIDIDRSTNQMVTRRAWPGYQLTLPKVH